MSFLYIRRLAYEFGRLNRQRSPEATLFFMRWLLLECRILFQTHSSEPPCRE